MAKSKKKSARKRQKNASESGDGQRQERRQGQRQSEGPGPSGPPPPSTSQYERPRRSPPDFKERFAKAAAQQPAEYQKKRSHFQRHALALLVGSNRWSHLGKPDLLVESMIDYAHNVARVDMSTTPFWTEYECFQLTIRQEQGPLSDNSVIGKFCSMRLQRILRNDKRLRLVAQIFMLFDALVWALWIGFVAFIAARYLIGFFVRLTSSRAQHADTLSAPDVFRDEHRLLKHLVLAGTLIYHYQDIAHAKVTREFTDTLPHKLAILVEAHMSAESQRHDALYRKHFELIDAALDAKLFIQDPKRGLVREPSNSGASTFDLAVGPIVYILLYVCLPMAGWAMVKFAVKLVATLAAKIVS